MKAVILFILLLSEHLAFAQNPKPIIFKRGIGFISPDSSLSVNIRFRIQNRILMNTVSAGNLSPESWEARVRRCRLVFTGHLYSPKLTYNLQLSFSRGDMDWNTNDISTQNTSPNILRDAVFYYAPTKNIQLGFGQTKLPGNRQRVISSGALQFYDRSLANAHFTLDRDFGIFLTLKKTLPNKFVLMLKNAISSGEGRNSIENNAGLAYTSRLEILPLGSFTDSGDYFEGDILREKKPKISLAAVYNYNDRAVRTQGQTGQDLLSPVSFQSFQADVLLKYQGFAVSSELLSRNAIGSPITNNGTAIRALVEGHGVNTQVSYCTKNKWEVALRHTRVQPSEAVKGLQKQIGQAGIGISKYILNHRLKCQGGVFRQNEKNLVSNVEHSFYFAVFQMELGI